MTAAIQRRRGGSGGGGGVGHSHIREGDLIAFVLLRWRIAVSAFLALIATLLVSIVMERPLQSTTSAMKYVENSPSTSSTSTLVLEDGPPATRGDQLTIQSAEKMHVPLDDLATADKHNSQSLASTTESNANSPYQHKRPRQHPNGLEKQRAKRIRAIGESTCKFPDFFYKNQEYIKYSLSDEGEYIKPGKWRRREKARYLTGEYEYEQGGRNDPARTVERKDLTRKVSFIHVGKAGGSSVSCSLREARKYGVGKHCKKSRFNKADYNETAISHQVDCYSHYNYNGFCYGRGRSYLYNVRNPMHRIKSWYLYEHYLNQPLTQSNFRNKAPHCGNIMLGTCYQSLDHLATVGLSEPRPLPSSKLRIGTNLSADECSAWAWAIVTGEVPASYHNAFNFDWYFAPMLDEEYMQSDEYTDNEIFLLRVEHLDKDWQTVDRMLGGDGTVLPGDVMPKSRDAKLNVAANMKLPVSNSTMSLSGWRNLCRAMCNELQVYKAMLRRAKNLDDADVSESIEELRQVCPDEECVTSR